MARQPDSKITDVQPVPSRWVMRYRGVKRMMMAHWCSRSLPLYLVTEFPKSGGTWYSQMLAECLELPFARNHNSPKFESCVMSGVHLYHRRLHNVSVVMRDGRDVMVSSYFHFLFDNNVNLPYAVEKKRRLLQFDNFEDTVTNMPRFIEYMFTDFAKSLSFRCTWGSFVQSWLNRDATIVKYEDLLSDGVGTLCQAVQRLTGKELSRDKVQAIVESYSFKNLTGRNAGQIEKNNFIRKGVAGDWKNHFSAEARQVFDHYAGHQLIDLGYESSHDWASA